MLLAVCRFTFLVLFCVTGHADVLLSTPQSLTVATDLSSLDEFSALTPTTTEADLVATSEPFMHTSMTYQPVTDTSTTEALITQQPSTATEETNEQAKPTTFLPNSTTTMPTSGTTVIVTTVTTPLFTNATTDVPTNASTLLPTNATTLEPNTTTPMPTNATTNVANTTTPVIVTTTVPPLPSPTVGDYGIKADPNSSFCLLARMGLQFSFEMGSRFQTVNLDPMANVTVNGTCGRNGSDSILILMSDKITVQFTFASEMSKFYLSAMHFTMDTGSGSNFSTGGTNLTLWETSLGSSYMCRKEQSYNITKKLILNTFQLQVQPFNVTNNKFSTAYECSVDDSSLLIPIVVGAALAGLILIVVIAYVIGRRKTYVGYQTL